MKKHVIISILTENRKGIVSNITGIICRKQLNLESISAATTDAGSVVMITLELFIEETPLKQLLSRIRNIVEVFSAESVLLENSISQRIAFFKLSKKFLETPQAKAIHKFGASIINIYPEAILLSKSGSNADIESLLNHLDGPHLISCIKSGLIAESSMTEVDEVRVMKMAA